ncbi:TPA: hypothetical protein ACH3X3_002270 [Trebouxia sp. C0006]
MAAAQYLQDLKAELQVLLAAKGQQLQADLSAVEAPVADLNDRMQDTMDRLSRQVNAAAVFSEYDDLDGDLNGQVA